MATTHEFSTELPPLAPKPAVPEAEHAGEALPKSSRRVVEGVIIGACLAALAGAVVAAAQAALGLPDVAAILVALAAAALAAEVGVAWARGRSEPRAQAAEGAAAAAARSDAPAALDGPSRLAPPAPILAPRGEPDPSVTGVEAWRRAAVRAVRAEGPDLSMRQTALLLTVYAADPPRTVSELADELGVAKPVISRAVDTLAGFGLLERRRDAEDRRKVFVERTDAGAAYLRAQAELFDAAQSEAGAAAVA